MRSLSLTLLLAIVLASACTNKTEQFQTESISDYTNLVVGKYITYRLDSLVFTNFGRVIATHRYQEKHVIDAQVTDNLGRPSFRVFRYQRDSVGLQPWVSAGSYYITPTDNQLEVIEDNFRVIKLSRPFREDFSWKGNTHVGDDPYEPLYKFSNDDNIADWEFYYDSFDPIFTYRNQTYHDVWTVETDDETYNVPIQDPASYAAKTRVRERYAKNIGMVYREYEIWEYQPNPGGAGGPFYIGYGTTMWMIDHN
jgi:hypothetical protein